MSRHRRRRSESSDSDESHSRHHRKKRRLSAEEEDQMIAEYLAKKAEKKALKLEKKKKTETFVWRKKIERDVCQGRVPLDDSYFAVKDEEERRAEIAKVKQRREERARQRAQREEEMELLARERARAEFQDWEKKEEELNYEQSRIKSEKRLREGRFKPIDHLVLMSKHLNGDSESDEDFDHMGMDLKEPYMHAFKGLAVEGLEELRDDIQMNLDHCNSAMPEHVEFWEALLVLCDSELVEARRKDAVDRARVRGEEPPVERKGLHSSVEADVKAVLDQYSTLSELDLLQRQTEEKVSGEDKLTEFWEAIHSRLPVLKAKAYLKEQYAKILHKYLQRLEQEVVDGEDNSDIVHGSRAEPMAEEDMEDETGSFSPQVFHGDEKEPVIDAEEDRALLERKRMAVLEGQQRRIQAATATAKPRPKEDDLEMRQVAMRAMGEMREGDVVFGSGSEVNINPSELAYNSLNDKYRPRKPKYYNRFHTGFEWNKYNQTHYDHDNPPPKVVLGYKFNIFYPDLIDRTKTPSYYIEKDEGVDNKNNDTCIIRFSAGPPYEDIAFRIVNRDWEVSQKKGYKSTFERGILQLYFNFKRYRYRR
ncbi:splicing factor Cactin-like [Rosa rugosa]|uniref:splicing factor Cactin-like n=1 Tax=Rosa rugosa TaxID=74645 RepID=UPI002B40772B|nr:splicing factor Cactin-like [Rosa rugosa]